VTIRRNSNQMRYFPCRACRALNVTKLPRCDNSTFKSHASRCNAQRALLSRGVSLRSDDVACGKPVDIVPAGDFAFECFPRSRRGVETSFPRTSAGVSSFRRLRGSLIIFHRSGRRVCDAGSAENRLRPAVVAARCAK